MRKAIMALEGLEEINNPDTPETLDNTDTVVVAVCPIHDPEEIIQNNLIQLDEDENDIDNISEATEETIETVAVLESINTILRTSETGLSPNGVKMLTTAIEHFSNRVGYKKQIIPAMECFGGTKSKLAGTKDLVVAIEGMIQDIWEGIKKAFKAMVAWIGDFFSKLFGMGKNIVAALDKTISNLNAFEKSLKSGNKPKAAMEDNSTDYTIDKELFIDPGTFGSYLGNDKKGLFTYIDSLRLLDHAILDALKHASDEFDWSGLNVGPNSSSLFKAPSTPEQKEFFKNKVPFSNADIKVIPLPFKKGFIWKVEGASFQHTKDYVEMLEVSAGVVKQNYSYDLEEVECLSLTEMKYILNKLKSDIEENGKNTHTIASAIIKTINDKSKEIEHAMNAIHTDNDPKLTETKQKFSKAKETLNALKNIEIGYWQFKNHTTVKIKEYCEASIRARRKDYQDFNTV
jgi:hypothetical protein